jgi:hypothetical protein
MYKIAAVVFIFCLTPGIYGFDIEVTHKELGIAVMPEYTRVFSQGFTMSGRGLFELNNRVSFKGGMAVWAASSIYEADIFMGGEYALPVRVPLCINLSYVYNGLPDYETHSHSLLHTFMIRGRWVGASLGFNLRLTSFYGEDVLFEPIIAFSGYVNFYTSEKFRIGISGANYNEFVAGNFGSYFFGLNSKVQLSNLVALTHDLELRQAGSIGLSANFYGIAYRCEVIFSW